MNDQEQHTPGPWEQGKPGDAIISKDPATLATAHERAADSVGHLDYYGGAVICESVSPRDRPIIKAAPAMLGALKRVQKGLTLLEPEFRSGPLAAIGTMREAVNTAIAQARGQEPS